MRQRRGPKSEGTSAYPHQVRFSPSATRIELQLFPSLMTCTFERPVPHTLFLCENKTAVMQAAVSAHRARPNFRLKDRLRSWTMAGAEGKWA